MRTVQGYVDDISVRRGNKLISSGRKRISVPQLYHAIVDEVEDDPTQVWMHANMLSCLHTQSAAHRREGTYHLQAFMLCRLNKKLVWQAFLSSPDAWGQTTLRLGSEGRKDTVRVPSYLLLACDQVYNRYWLKQCGDELYKKIRSEVREHTYENKEKLSQSRLNKLFSERLLFLLLPSAIKETIVRL
jgi:hypothetical protein